MRKIIVLSMITLDGIIQAPGGPKEDALEGLNMVVGLRLMSWCCTSMDYLKGYKDIC